ncbi:hypothetical protein JCM8547_003372 [Rhodosporidiobolus lusitaniae]
MTSPTSYAYSGHRLGSSSTPHASSSAREPRPREAAALAALSRSLGGVEDGGEVEEQETLDISNGEEKERAVRLNNPTIKANVQDIPRAFDLLIRSGFHRRDVDFEEKLVFPPLPSASSNCALLSCLTTGHSVLSLALQNAQSSAALEKTREEASEAEKKRVMQGVLEEIKEDREMMRRREERERERRRKAREEKEVREKATRGDWEWDRA